MWGVGLADSDVDLIDLYGRWAEHAKVIDIINLSADVAKKTSSLFSCDVQHFASPIDWKRTLE